MNIITITLNPAIDVHIAESEINNGKADKRNALGCYSGGKGVNVSRALLSLGHDSVCCVAVGEDNADEYLESLSNSGLNVIVERVSGTVRVNLHANTESGDLVLAGQGACVDNKALLNIKNRVLPMISAGDFVCLCGGLPPGCDKDFVIDLLREIKRIGAKVILDSRSFGIDDIRDVYPYMIKPNLEELIALSGLGNVGKENAVILARELSGETAENVFVTLGSSGAVYASADAVYEVEVPQIDAISTTGAGDSLIAGYLYALSQGRDIIEVLRLAAASGTAACLTAGTLPPLKSDVEKIADKITVSKYTV